MFIQEKKSNKILRIIFKTIILSVGSYSIFSLFVLKKGSNIYLWMSLLTATGAVIYEQITFMGYSAMEYFEAERADRKQKRELWLILTLMLFSALIFVLIFIFGK